MSKFVKALAGAVLAVAAGSAFAVPATWVDNHLPANGPVKLDANLLHLQLDTYSWTFDISDNGFDVGTDSVTGYSVNLLLRDDKDSDGFLCLWGCEFAFYHEDQNWLLDGVAFEVDGNEAMDAWVSGIAKLNENGTLSVSLTAVSGDFWFDGATLTAEGVDVPEPASLALLGMGLLVLGAARRRVAR